MGSKLQQNTEKYKYPNSDNWRLERSVCFKEQVVGINPKFRV